jgi:hypothetical protein
MTVQGFGFFVARSARRRGFNPASLFAGGQQGAWYDPSDLGSMFQDNAGTVAAAVGAPVGRIADKSGRGHHAVQSTQAARPILRQDPAGRLYLEFDGVDDRLTATGMSLAQPWDRVSAIRQMGIVPSGRVYSFGSTAAYAGMLYQSQSPAGLVLYDGASGAANPDGGAIGTTIVVTERRNGSATQLVVNRGAASTGSSGTNAANGVSIGADPGGAGALALHFYGLCMVKPALGANQIASLRAWFAARAGVTI